MCAYPKQLVLLCSFLLMASLSSCGGGGSSTDFTGVATVESLGVTAGSTKTIAGGSIITVTGDDSIDGTLIFQAGGATVIFEGDVAFNGVVQGTNTTPSASALQTQDSTTEDQEPDDIIIVPQQNATFGENFELTTDTSLKIASNPSALPTNDESDADAESDDGTGNTLIPLPDTGDAVSPLVIEEVAGSPSTFLAQVVRPVWRFRGRWVFNTPPPGVKRIVVAIQPDDTDAAFEDLNITGPDGRAGEDQTKTGTCTGKDGKNAMTFVARINGNLTVNNFILTLGNGGKGGDCTAEGDPNATATGGNGGKNGKMKMRTTGSFDIQGAFTINPGRGGHGGAATANALDGNDACPPTDGGNATATGGTGADKKKVLRARGVNGIGNITIGDMDGGTGGAATANAGQGGDNTCACPPKGNGANGGDGEGTGGQGGEASLNVSGLGVTIGNVTGGDGGDATANNGKGGKGTDCDKNAGGDGGTGGDMTATKGEAGTGTTAGTDGTASLGTDAGKGGTGGDGIPPGSGGSGGTCTIDGSSTPCPNGDDGTLRLDLITFLCIDLFDVFQAILGAPGSSSISALDQSSLTSGVPLVELGGSTTVGTVPIEILDLGGGFIQTSDPTATPPHIGLQNGTIQTELVQLELTDSSPILVGIRISGNTFGDPSACPQIRITGDTAGQPSAGQMDVTLEPDGDNQFQVDSFFDVFFEVDIASDPVTNVRVQGHDPSLGTPSNCPLFLDFLCIIDP